MWSAFLKRPTVGLVLIGIGLGLCQATRFRRSFSPVSHTALAATEDKKQKSPDVLVSPHDAPFDVNAVRSATLQDRTRTAAEKTFAEGDQLRDEWNEESSLKAIEKYEQALVLWKSLGEHQQEANTLKTLGDVWRSQSELKKALNFYAAAFFVIRKTHARQIESEILSSMGYTYFSLGENLKAMKLGVQALRSAKDLNSRSGEAQAFDVIGEAHIGMGDTQKAISSYEQALTRWRSLNDLSGQALALLHIGYAYSDLSDTEKALDSYDKALPLWRLAKNRWGEALTLTAVGHLYSKLGKKQKALDLYDQAVNMFRPMGDKIGQAFVFNGMGYVFEELGENDKALDNYINARRLFQIARYREGEAGSLYKIGKMYFALGNTQEALNYYGRSRLVSSAIRDKRMEAVPVALMGQVYLSLGDKQKALYYYRQALLLNRIGEDRREEAHTLSSIGHVYENAGESRRALPLYNQALRLNRATRDRFGESMSLHNIARAERALGNFERAKTHSEQGLEIVESLRTQVAGQNLRSSYVASVHQQYELQIDILMRMDKQNPDRGFAATALATSERARARSLLDILTEAGTDIRQGVDSALLERERWLQQQLNLLAARQLRLNKDEKKEAETIDQELRKLTSEHQELEGQIRVASPRYAALTQSHPLSLEEIQQLVLDENSLLLEYALGDERSYIWAVTRTQVSSYELPGRAEIERAARNVYDLLTANQPKAGEAFEQRQARIVQAKEQLPSQIANLSKILLAPVGDKLGTKRLLIVPDGALQYIPFQILNTASGARPLVVDHEIVNEPSASTLALLVTEAKTRQPASGSVAVLADPVFEADDPRIPSAAKLAATSVTAQPQETELHHALRDVGLSGDGSHIPRLLASREEADAILSVTPWRSGLEAVGFEASRTTAMKSDLAGYRIVHFATHGLLNNEHPELSGIVLSLVDEQGQPQDGFLRLHDIYDLKLPVDLVVLSACNTGLGKDVRGEGLIGLTRGFMYAGASSIVASLWKVDDEATGQLMRLFYGYMLRDGLSPAAALRKAQVTMSQEKRWQSPYYWAGFVIQGQYLSSQKTARFAIPRFAFFVFGAVVVVAAVFYILKRRRKISL